MQMEKVNEIIKLGKEIRRLSLILAHNSNTSHTAGALSMADILAVLYSGVLQITPQTTNDISRDRLVLSKGHCCVSLYAVLALKGFLKKDELLRDYGRNGTDYFTHASHKLNGVELSTGSLGHGLSVSAGFALGGKRRGLHFDAYCIIGDGELDEGSNWEAIMFAAHQKLDNLCLIVDKNKMQALGDTKNILNLDPLIDKFRSFQWNAHELDGHNYDELLEAFSNFRNTANNKPTVLICNTIKGKGVSYMEHNLKWHYSAPNDILLQLALEELK
jgi:transketolase